jgi:hypothetical protein
MPPPTKKRKRKSAAPPVVQSASLIRTRSKSTFPQSSPTPVAVNLSPGVPEAPVIEELTLLIPHDTSIEAGENRQPQDEDLEPTQILRHVCCFPERVSLTDLLKVANTSTPWSPLPRQARPSQSLPRLSIIPKSLPRTVTRSLLPKSTSRFTSTMSSPDRGDNEDVMSSDDDSSSDSDNQNSKQIPANQQAESRPVFRRHRNVLASF